MWLASWLLCCAELASLRFAGPADMQLLGACDTPEDAVALWPDADGDGFGDAGDVARGCPPHAGWTTQAGDCDDDDAAVNPGEPERCNGRDDDCDLTVDEAPDRLWCADVDLDGLGDPGDGIYACDAPVGYVSDCSDIDDRMPD
jgi:hypothetical protein